MGHYGIRKKTGCHFAALLFIAFIIGYGLSGISYAKEGAEEKRCNLIVISLDTLRPDHLGCYGYSRMTSANIDKLAEEGILFEQAIAQASWTLPSQASFFTSQYVPTHQIDAADCVLPGTATTLAEALRAYGYRTAAFTGGFHISSIYGLNQGFDAYFDKIEFGNLENILPRAEKWLQAQPQPFFLFLQAYDAHAPYRFPERYGHIYDSGYKGLIDRYIMDHRLGDMIRGYMLTDKNGKTYKLNQGDIQHIIAHYDAAITYADKQLGAFFNTLKKLNLWDNSIIIFLGDHGEPLLEHGRILVRQHGGLYEEGIHVPLIMRFPMAEKRMRRGIRIKTQAQLIDIMPTILDYADIPIHHSCQGSSLIPLINGRAPRNFNEYVFTSGASCRLGQFQAAVRTSKWKLLQYRYGKDSPARYELYNLIADPKEQNDRYSLEPEIASRLQARLDNWIKTVSSQRSFQAGIDGRLWADMIKRMRKFGYWWLEDPPKPPKK